MLLLFDWIPVMFYNFGRGSCEAAFCGNPFGILKDWLYIGKGTSPLAEMFKTGGVVENMFNAFSGIAGMLIMLYFVLFLYEEFVRHGEATLQMFEKILLKFGLAFLIMINGLPLVTGFCKMGDVLIDITEGAFSKDNENSLSVMRDICSQFGYYPDENGHIPVADEDKPNFGLSKEGYELYNKFSAGDYLCNSCQLLAMNLVSIVVSVIAVTTAITRTIQIIVYASLSPLAIADIFGDGMSSRGIRFFKKLFAVAVQGPIIYFICQLHPVLSGYALKADSGLIGGIGSIAAYFAVVFAILAALKKAEKFASDIIL